MVTPYAYPLWLDMGHMPQPCEDGRSYDFITWYARWDGRAEEIGLIGHGVIDAEDTVVEGLQVRFVGKPIPALGSLTNAVRYSMWAFLAIFRSAFDALLGSWSHAVLLAEAARAAKVRFAEPRDLARDYLFHISQPCYRPLWTYEAEKRGSRILFYFYSASQEYKLPSGYEPERYAWGPMNWPHYLVWDKYQEEYVCGLLDYHPKIDIVGPIWSRDINVELPEIPRRSVAVFDVQPFKRSAHFGFATIAELQPDNAHMEKQFLLDVDMALREQGMKMVYKRKRRWVGINRKYLDLVQRLTQGENMLSIEPAISAIRVVEKCQATISYPFTSPGLLAKHQGKPSVYYDPLGVIQKDDLAAHGLEVVSGIDELRKWVARLLVEEERELLLDSEN